MSNRDRTSLWRFLLLYGAVVVVFVTVLGGLGAWTVIRAMSPDAPGRRPFDAALLNLAAAPELHYRSTVPSLGAVDVRVTSHDELVGTLGTGVQALGLLRVGGTFYVKPPPTGLPNASSAAAAAAMRNRWVTGHDITSLLGPIPSRFESPSLLAARLADALSRTRGFPPLDDRGTMLDGARVVHVGTSLGELSVTRDTPHRVVRLGPASSGPGVGMLPAVTAFAESAPPLGSMDFGDEQPGDVGRTYDALRQDTRALGAAVDSDLRFDLQGNGQISCSGGGCQVSVTVTNSVSAGAPSAKVVGGAVRAMLTAAISIEGQPADGCTGSGSLPLNGTGTLVCADPGAGGLFTSIEGQKKAAAEAQSRAENGAPVPYSVNYRGEYSVYATAQVDVEQLVRTQDREASDAARRAACPSSIAAVQAPVILVADVSCDDGVGPIRYNSDELSRAAFKARVVPDYGGRVKLAWPLERNVAVARVPGWNDPKNGDLVIGYSKGKDSTGNVYHAENHILDQLRVRGFDSSRITALYTEREPCEVCSPLLEDKLKEGTPVSWTLPRGYGDSLLRTAIYDAIGQANGR